MVALVVVGCSKPKHKSSESLVITPGVGISNIVALGMSASDIGSSVVDMTYTVEPIRWPWQENWGSGHAFWEKPDWQNILIPSLGVQWGGAYVGKRKPCYSFINFHTVAEGYKNSQPFRGSLSCGIDLSETNEITPSLVIQNFGEPSKTIPLDSNVWVMLVEGISFRIVTPEHESELLYYPADGIMFDFREGSLTRLAVYPKSMTQQPLPIGVGQAGE